MGFGGGAGGRRGGTEGAGAECERAAAQELRAGDVGPALREFRLVRLVAVLGSRGVHLNLHRSWRSEEHTSELQSRGHLVCRLLLEKKKKKQHARRGAV